MFFCPVCRARFRGSRVCSRCGADLGPLMALAVKAWRRRAAACRALEAGDPAGALALASEAQRVCWTSRGAALRILSAWLQAQSAPASPTAA